MWRKGNHFTLLVEKQIGANTMESSVEMSQKIKSGSAFGSNDPSSGDISEETHSTNLKEHKYSMFIAALFTIAKIGRQLKCLSVDEWMKLWDIYRIEYYSSIKKKKILPFVMA